MVADDFDDLQYIQRNDDMLDHAVPKPSPCVFSKKIELSWAMVVVGTFWDFNMRIDTRRYENYCEIAVLWTFSIWFTLWLQLPQHIISLRSGRSPTRAKLVAASGLQDGNVLELKMEIEMFLVCLFDKWVGIIQMAWPQFSVHHMYILKDFYIDY